MTSAKPGVEDTETGIKFVIVGRGTFYTTLAEIIQAIERRDQLSVDQWIDQRLNESDESD